jgi:hypothetical protein
MSLGLTRANVNTSSATQRVRHPTSPQRQAGDKHDAQPPRSRDYFIAAVLLSVDDLPVLSYPSANVAAQTAVPASTGFAK